MVQYHSINGTQTGLQVKTVVHHLKGDVMLTDTKIRNAKPVEKRYRIADSDGLYIEISPSGKKYWRFRSNTGGKRSWHDLGEYPHVSLRQARELRDKARHPAEAPHTTGSCLFSQAASEWVDIHERKLNNDKEKQNIRSRLDNHILPFIGGKEIAELTAMDILPLMKRLSMIGKYEMSRRVKQIISQIFRYAIMSGYCQNDPTYALRGFIDAPKPGRFASLTRPSEVARLLRAIHAYPHVMIREAMRFSALVFLRPGEVRHTEWLEIEGNELRIPKEKMKMDRPHIVPLARQTLELLDRLRPITGHCKYLFPSARSPEGGRPMSENAVLAALRSMGYTKDQMTPHGFRSMASTLLNENGFNRDWIERQLAHAEGNGVRAAYNYAEYLPERRKMMQWWADYLDELRESA
jgi:integrase